MSCILYISSLSVCQVFIKSSLLDRAWQRRGNEAEEITVYSPNDLGGGFNLVLDFTLGEF
jgi:hypothetical protein